MTGFKVPIAGTPRKVSYSWRQRVVGDYAFLPDLSS